MSVRFVNILKGVLIATVAIVFFIRCYVHEPQGDELLYEYVWEKDDPKGLWEDGHKFDRKISSLNDIIITQITHYQKVNGRAILHSIEQAFTGHTLAFGLINTVVFMLLTCMIIHYTTSPAGSKKLYVWILTFTGLLYLFPAEFGIWTSINMGLNYLWPACALTALLIVCKTLVSSKLPANLLPWIAVLAFFCGWSNEAFALALSGSLFLYVIINIRSINRQLWFVIIPLWTGTIMMLLSPGNLIRFIGEPGSSESSIGIFMKLMNGLDIFIKLYMTWVTVGLLLFAWLTKQITIISTIIKDNIILTLSFICALAFSLICNTSDWSFTCVVLLMFLFNLKLIYSLKWPCISLRIANYVSYIAALLIIVQQTALAFDTFTVYKWQHKVVETYKTSSDGLVALPPLKLFPFSESQLRGSNPATWVGYNGFARRVYGKSTKPTYFFLEQSDYQAVVNPTSYFIPENKFAGNAPVYHKPGSVFLWIQPDQHKANASYQVVFKPFDFNYPGLLSQKIKFALIPYQNPPEITTIDTIVTRHGVSYKLGIANGQYIKEVNVL